MKVQVSLKVYKSDFESLIKTDTQKDVTLYVELNNIKSLKKILFTHKNCLNKEILLMTLLKRNKKHECKTLLISIIKKVLGLFLWYFCYPWNICDNYVKQDFTDFELF